MPRTQVLFITLVLSLGLIPCGFGQTLSLPTGQNVLSAGYLRSPVPEDTAALIELAQTHDLLILHEWSEDKIATFRAANPDIILLLYKNRGFMDNTVESVATYSSVAQNDNWFMHDAAGNHITWDWDGNGTLDGASPRPEVVEWQDFFLDRAVASVRDGGWDGLFIDDLWTQMGTYGTPDPVEYDSDVEMQAAMVQFLTRARQRLHSEGMIIAGNIGWWDTSSPVSGQRAGQYYLEQLDLGMEEKFLVYYTTYWHSGRQWFDEMNALRDDIASTGNTAFLFARGDDANRTALLYSLCSQLCITERDGGVVFQYLNVFDNTRVTPIFPECDIAEDLGAPTGDVQWSSLHSVGYRQFENGYVIVNPNTSSRTVSGFADMLDIDGNVVPSSGLVLPAHSGMILFEPDPGVDPNPDPDPDPEPEPEPTIDSLDLSGWTYFPAAVAAGTLGPTFVGDSEVLGYAADDNDVSDNSVSDLVIDHGGTRGDSYVYFASPPDLIPHEPNGTYMLQYRISAIGFPSTAYHPTMRLRWAYGLFGALGSGATTVTPAVAPSNFSGRTYTTIFDHLDVASANGTVAVGDFVAQENSVQALFESIDLIGGVGLGTVELDGVVLTQLDRNVLVAGSALEREVSDWSDPTRIDSTGAFNAATGTGVVLDMSSADHATLTAGFSQGFSSTLDAFGNPMTLSLNGVGLIPFAPSVTTGKIFRAEFDLDFSASQPQTPLPLTNLTLATFGNLGQHYTTEVSVGQTRNMMVTQPIIERNPALDSSTFAVYLALPEDGQIAPGQPLGDRIGANVRLIDSTNSAGGTLTINALRITSFPTTILP